MSLTTIPPTEGSTAIPASEGPGSSAAADALNASRRVQQLQSLVAQASAGSTASFAAALEAASAGTGADQIPASYPSSTDEAPSSGLTQTAALSPSVYGSPTSASGSTPATAGASVPGAESPALTTGSESPSSSAYDATISAVAARYGLDPAVLHGLIQQESGFNPSAQSGAGALGLTQLMPSTAASLGVSEPLNPTQSIEGGARYLSEMLQRFGGNTANALAAYNAGPGAVEQYGGVPPYAETQEYVAKVMANANAYRQTHPATVNPALAGTYPTTSVTATGGATT